MTPAEALSRHLELCEELHQLALEENRFLKAQQRSPDAALIERRRSLLDRLNESLTAIRPAAEEPAPTERVARELRKETIEKARTRILQILHLQKENEQLVLRYSLGAPRPPSVPPPPAAGHLQKLYDRHR